MITQGMLRGTGVPEGNMTNSFVRTSIQLGNIWVPSMEQAQRYVMELG